MDSLSTSIEADTLPEVSTQLDEGRVTDPGQAVHKEEQPQPSKPESRLDAIKRAAADLEKGEDKPAKTDEGDKDAEPAKSEPKAKPDEDGAEQKREEAPKLEAEPAKQEGTRDQRDEQRRHVEAPAKFLPKAKELWRNTPHAVQHEVERIVKEHEAELQQIREVAERYETVRQYDEIARQNGRNLGESLAKVVEIENAMQANPIAGLNRILMEVGPRKPDGQPVSLYEVAQHIIAQGPEAYQQMMMQAAHQQPQQPASDPRVEMLQQQLASMQQQQLAMQVIEPFKRDHPRYDELQQDIAFFLQSGRIPNSLSHYDRLAAAYDMAERINPPSNVDYRPAPDRGLAEQPSRADDSLSGTKSIKGAPASGVDTASKRKRTMSRSEAIQAAMADLNLA